MQNSGARAVRAVFSQIYAILRVYIDPSSVLFIDRAAVLLNNDRHNPKTFSLEITMSEVPHDGGSPIVRNVLMVAGVVYLLGTVIFMVVAQGRMNDLEKKSRPLRRRNWSKR